MVDGVVPGDSAPAAALALLRAALSHEGEVAVAYVYGSAARGRPTPLSDLDVAVLPMPGVEPGRRARLQRHLMAVLERAVPGRVVEVRFLDELPVAVRGRVVTEGVRLCERDPVVRVREEVKARMAYHDFLPFERAGLAVGLQGLKRKLGRG